MQFITTHIRKSKPIPIPPKSEKITNISVLLICKKSILLGIKNNKLSHIGTLLGKHDTVENCVINIIYTETGICIHKHDLTLMGKHNNTAYYYVLFKVEPAINVNIKCIQYEQSNKITKFFDSEMIFCNQINSGMSWIPIEYLIECDIPILLNEKLEISINYLIYQYY
jgi:hypothetical protein